MSNFSWGSCSIPHDMSSHWSEQMASAVNLELEILWLQEQLGVHWMGLHGIEWDLYWDLISWDFMGFNEI